ncbi:calcium-binding protein [Ponticoccus alexandrii]|nr:calcium-binding protein [Ponticoccus alexandrii]
MATYVYDGTSLNNLILDPASGFDVYDDSFYSSTLGDRFDNLFDLTGITAYVDGSIFEMLAGNDQFLGSELGENVFGGEGNDSLTGNGGNDSLWGGLGADTLRGGSGNDQLVGDQGVDLLDGGEGNDLFLFGSGGDVDILRGGSGTDIGYYSGDYLQGLIVDAASSIEVLHQNSYNGYYGDNAANLFDVSGVQSYVGAADFYLGGGNDTFVGSDVAEWAMGQFGNDTLLGNGGDDRLQGWEDDDLLRGGAGADTLEGGSGTDTADYTGSSSWVNVSLLTGYTSGGHAQGDVLSGIENLTGSAHGDRLSGDHGANVLRGQAGDDILRGRGGADTLEGGAGSDIADYSESAGWVNVSLISGYAGGGAGSHAIGDVWIGIENLIGSDFADRLNGDNGENVLEGRAGGDIFNGYGGSDTLSYASSVAWVNVSLLTGYTGGGAGNHAAGDSWTSIENLRGSAHADRLNGDHGANVLEGGAGGDIVNGNGGSDTLSYASSEAWVNVSLLTGYTGGGAGNHAAGDSWTSIENLRGSAHADRLNGDHGANVLEGGAGGDIVNGNGGSDTLSYASSVAWVNVSLLTGYTGGGAGNHAAGDSWTSIENLRGSAHADRLNGDHGANVLEGGAGNDILRGNGGIDTFVFADGFGSDSVLDYQNGSEKFDFTDHAGVSGFGDLTVSASGADALIADGFGNQITVTGAAGLIDATDFIF